MAGYPRVLSIQSHVVSGYVGNKSACFPLQVLGFEVDTINSVQLSNHTGYDHWTGQLLNANDLEELFIGLKLNDLHHYTHLLTGYVGTTSFLKKVIEVVKELKQVNPDLYYGHTEIGLAPRHLNVCDPVLGDNNKMYLPEDMLPLYRDHLIPFADLITPNQFEAEWLTGVTIHNEADMVKALDIFHSKGVKAAVISSANIGASGNLTVLGSSLQGSNKTVVRMEVPYLQETFLGTGDLFAAILLAWMTKTDGDLKVSCENVINTLQSVLRRTLESTKAQINAGEKLSPGLLELKLIQSKEDIENPRKIYQATSSTK